MGEKPMGAPSDGGDQDPESAAAGIITTRSNIKHAGAAATAGDAGGGVGGGEPDEPGGDSPESAANQINTTRDNIPRNPRPASAGVVEGSEPIPGVDIIVKKPTS